MRKILLFSLVVSLAFVSCKEDVTSSGSSFPTDNLTVDKQQNVLLLEQTGVWCPYCPIGAEQMKMETEKHGDRLVAIALHGGGTDPLKTAVADAIRNNCFDTITSYPWLVVMNESSGQDASHNVLAALTPAEAPYFAVKHTVEITDSSYNVYSKVEVLREVNNQDFFIQSYLLLDGVIAKDYGNGLDLNQQSNQPYVSGTNPTKWALDAAIVDGEPTAKAGDIFYHEEVVFGVGLNTPDIWGFPLGAINPFGTEYLEGDILGTKYTPIIVSIPLVDITPLESSYSVATIIWMYKDDGSGFYDYINGYVAHLN